MGVMSSMTEVGVYTVEDLYAYREQREDMTVQLLEGELRVLVELVAGAPTVPGLKAQVADRINRWEDLVAEAAERFIPALLRSRIRPTVVANAVVAGFLGLELLRDLREDGAGTEDVLTDLEQVA